MSSRQPIVAKGEMLWVNGETAEKIKRGEIDPEKPANPAAMAALMNFARGLMSEEKATESQT